MTDWHGEVEGEEINRISHTLYRNSPRAVVLSLYGGKGGNYIEKEGIISNNQCGENLGKKKASTAVAFLVVGGAKSNKSNANNESEYVGNGSMCRDTFFSFLQCPFTLCGGAEELFSPLIVQKPTPCRKGAVASDPVSVFSPGKKGRSNPPFPQLINMDFVFRTIGKHTAKKGGQRGEKNRKLTVISQKRCIFCCFRNYFSEEKMSKPSSHPKIMYRAVLPIVVPKISPYLTAFQATDSFAQSIQKVLRLTPTLLSPCFLFPFFQRTTFNDYSGVVGRGWKEGGERGLFGLNPLPASRGFPIFVLQ